MGALLFELLTGLPPFYTNDKKQLFHNILRGHLVIPDHLSPNARDLIQRLLHRDPKQRLGSGPTGDREIFVRTLYSLRLLGVYSNYTYITLIMLLSSRPTRSSRASTGSD